MTILGDTYSRGAEYNLRDLMDAGKVSHLVRIWGRHAPAGWHPADCVVAWHHQQSFTACLLRHADPLGQWQEVVGVAKQCQYQGSAMHDAYDAARGEQIAFSRALQNAAFLLPRQPTPKPAWEEGATS